MVAICVGVLLLPWGRAPRSGILGEGKYALALALTGLLIYTLVASRRLDLRWWRRRGGHLLTEFARWPRVARERDHLLRAEGLQDAGRP